MNTPVLHHSQSWVVFTYVSFIAALTMVVVGIVLAPIDLAMKGYFAMGALMLIQSCIPSPRRSAIMTKPASWLAG